MSSVRALRLGSRRSPMAMAQAVHVSERLRAAAPGLDVEIVGIETSGDRWRGALADLGGKGTFLKEIERALVDGAIDAAVHCVKDVPGDVPAPEGTEFAGYLARDDVHDVVVFPEGSAHRTLAGLPAGATIGTSAVRRAAQLLRHRPDLRVEPFRGNVNSRLARLDAERPVDAVILARAGLDRIGRADRAAETLPLDVMCPAVGAGVLGLQCRTADTGVADLLRALDDPATRTRVAAERAMLRGLRGHCNSPIAGHCTATADGPLSLLGMVFTPDGGELARVRASDEPGRAEELGAYVADALAGKGAHRIIEAIPH
ncbi:MAG TPA: hydroxymethylbilane synthase [Streptosporangiaceae bacterium]